MTNSSQGVTASLTLSAFGQTVASTGSSSSAYQFGATSGYRTEGDAGLTLVGCRYYDAQVGRFISRDTYLDQKPYAYCDGDPVNATDPSGHNGVGDALDAISDYLGDLSEDTLFRPSPIVIATPTSGLTEGISLAIAGGLVTALAVGVDALW